MPALLHFNNVAIDQADALSFSIAAGDIRILKVASHEVKMEIINLALGDLAPANGEISLQGQPLEATRPGMIGWIPGDGGLISNLKTWENITLPLWYHNKRQIQSTEEKVMRWLRALNIDNRAWEDLMSSPAARLTQEEHKLAGLLRGLVLAPQLLVVDAGLFDELDDALRQMWIKVLETYVSESDYRALLVVTSAFTSLPWKIIE